MANDCTNNDDVFVPDTVVDPPGSGNPDGGPVQEDIMDINANYCVNAEDPFQNGESTTPLELWELPEAGVEKAFTYIPADINPVSGKALYKPNSVYTKRTYLDYESSGTIKYTPYGNHALTSSQYTTIVGNSRESTFDGITYEADYQDILDAPEVDEYRLIVYNADKVSGGYGISEDYKGRAHVATFWDLESLTVQHVIKLDIVSRDVVLSRSPSYPSAYNTQTDALTYNRTNLQHPNQSGVYISRFPVDDSNRCWWGRSDGSRVTSTRGAGSKYGSKFYKNEITLLNWKNKNRSDMTYNVQGRVLAHLGAVSDADTSEYYEPQGVPSAIKVNRSAYGSEPGQHIITLNLPDDVTSVTTLDWELTLFEPFILNKWLQANRGTPIRNTSAAAMTHVHQNDNAPKAGTRVADRGDWTVGAGRLRAGSQLGYQYRISTNKTGLRMAVMYLNHAHHFRPANSFGGTLQSVMEFRRADKNSPWEPYGSFTAKDVFDPRWPNWENTVGNQWDTVQRWDAALAIHPFYDDNDGDLWCISYGRYGKNSLYPQDYSECFKPDLVASSHARDIGTVSTESYTLNNTNTPQIGARFLDARDVTNIVVYNVDRDELDLRYNYKEFYTDYTTGTVTKQDLYKHSEALPPRLAHLADLEWYEMQQFETAQQSIVYNGFTIASLPDTPAVPNAALKSYSFWQGNGVYGTPPGTYRTNSSRRVMMRIGELSAQDASGNEVWRAEPPDARDWAKFNTRTRTMGRDMLFYAYPEQTDVVINEFGYGIGINADEVRRTDPEFADLQGTDGTPATFYTAAGLNIVKFGETMFMVGTKLYVSHNSLPTGDDLPPVGDWDARKSVKRTSWTTPRDATSPHEFGWIIIDLALIPELNP